MTFDVSEFIRLAEDAEVASTRVLSATRAVLQKSASEAKDLWRDNAKVTAGAHGKHYPNSITYETRVSAGSVIAEIGPDSSKPQGGMSFENGSVRQPPHLDGARAGDVVFPLLPARIAAALEGLGL